MGYKKIIFDNVGRTLILKKRDERIKGSLAVCSILNISEDSKAVEIIFGGWKSPEWKEIDYIVKNLNETYELITITSKHKFITNKENG